MKKRFLSAGCLPKRPVGRSGFFFLLFIFLLTRIYGRYKGGGGEYKNINKKYKVPVGPFKSTRAVDRKQICISGWPQFILWVCWHSEDYTPNEGPNPANQNSWMMRYLTGSWREATPYSSTIFDSVRDWSLITGRGGYKIGKSPLKTG